MGIGFGLLQPGYGTIWPICAESAVGLKPQPTNHATWLGHVSRLLQKTTLTTDYGKSAAAVAEKIRHRLADDIAYVSVCQQWLK